MIKFFIFPLFLFKEVVLNSMIVFPVPTGGKLFWNCLTVWFGITTSIDMEVSITDGCGCSNLIHVPHFLQLSKPSIFFLTKTSKSVGSYQQTIVVHCSWKLPTNHRLEFEFLTFHFRGCVCKRVKNYISCTSIRINDIQTSVGLHSDQGKPSI